jgi:hypothetical protein
MDSTLRMIFGDGTEEVCVVRRLSADGGREDAADEEEEARLGPVVSGLLQCRGAGAPSGIPEVHVPELASPRLAAPLLAYLRCPPRVLGEDPWDPWDPKDTRAASYEQVAASYGAASERLAVPGFVRAIEAWLVDRIHAGGLTLAAASAAFGAFPRLAAICDNFVRIAGRAPPTDIEGGPAGIEALATLRGAVLVADIHAPDYWLVASPDACRRLRDDHPVCRRVADADADATAASAAARAFVVYPLGRGGRVQPTHSSTWFNATTAAASVSTSSVATVLKDAHVSLVVAPTNTLPAPAQGYLWTDQALAREHLDGEIVYSRDAAADFVYSTFKHRSAFF